MAMVTYLVAVVLAAQIPPARVASAPAGEAERSELRSAGIVMAGSAMGLLRACVGFLTLLIAFDFRGDRATWQLGVVAGVSVLSQLAGAAVAPRIREHTTEENLLTGALAMVVFGGVLALVIGDVAGAAILGASVGFSAAGPGKLCVRLDPPARRPRRQPGSGLRPVRDPLPDHVGARCADPGVAHHPTRRGLRHRGGTGPARPGLLRHRSHGLGPPQRVPPDRGHGGCARDRGALHRGVGRGARPPHQGAQGCVPQGAARLAGRPPARHRCRRPLPGGPGRGKAYDEAYDDGYDDGGPYRTARRTTAPTSSTTTSPPGSTPVTPTPPTSRPVGPTPRAPPWCWIGRRRRPRAGRRSRHLARARVGRRVGVPVGTPHVRVSSPPAPTWPTLHRAPPLPVVAGPRRRRPPLTHRRPSAGQRWPAPRRPRSTATAPTGRPNPDPLGPGPVSATGRCGPARGRGPPARWAWAAPRPTTTGVRGRWPRPARPRRPRTPDRGPNGPG